MQNETPNTQFSTQYSPQEINDLVMHRVVYPEVFYKLQPFIMICCDQMDMYGDAMPTQEMLDQMTDGIYNDVCRMYPDIAEYANSCDKKTGTDPYITDVINGFDRSFRRRGLLRDIIGILLLSELFRRRRRIY